MTLPDDTMIITTVQINITDLTGPFEQELRDELRRQLDAIGVELKPGSALTELPVEA